MTNRYVGGSFAPPLTDDALARYADIAKSATAPVQDAMTKLLSCVSTWWNLPESNGTTTTPHSSGRGTIIPLDGVIAKTLYDLIPWEHELDAIQSLFDRIDPSQKDLRNAAFHLLWHVKELNQDREPVTADKL